MALRATGFADCIGRGRKNDPVISAAKGEAQARLARLIAIESFVSNDELVLART
jgi:hypothetical protein